MLRDNHRFRGQRLDPAALGGSDQVSEKTGAAEVIVNDRRKEQTDFIASLFDNDLTFLIHTSLAWNGLPESALAVSGCKPKRRTAEPSLNWTF